MTETTTSTSTSSPPLSAVMPLFFIFRFELQRMTSKLLLRPKSSYRQIVSTSILFVERHRIIVCSFGVLPAASCRCRCGMWHAWLWRGVGGGGNRLVKIMLGLSVAASIDPKPIESIRNPIKSIRNQIESSRNGEN
jgi:hypothetical protein